MSRRKTAHVPLKDSIGSKPTFVVLGDGGKEVPVETTNDDSGRYATASAEKQPHGTRRTRDSVTKKRSAHRASDTGGKNVCDPDVSDPVVSDPDDGGNDPVTDEELHPSEAAALDVLANKLCTTTLFDAPTDVAGERIFGFRTPKKSDSMNSLALASAQRTPHTPKSAPDVAHAKASGHGVVPKTPMHLRRIAKKEITKMLQSSTTSDFSASESDYAPSSDGTDDDESDSESLSSDDNEQAQGKQKGQAHGSVDTQPRLAIPVPKHMTESQATGPARSGRGRRGATTKQELEYIVQSDDYFSTFTNTKAATSHHTLDRLNMPRLTQKALFKLLNETHASPAHTVAINELLVEYEQQFDRWMFLMDEGFNVLLYGLGSKRSLLQSFHRRMLRDRPVLVVNGFFPGLTVKDVLDGVASDLLDLRLATVNHHETIDAIKRELSYLPNTHLFLLVHNLDGVAMRNERMQIVLCRLATIPNVHLVATIDHINGPLLWDESKLRNYNFCWWDASTLLPYSIETAYENSLLVQNSGAPALSSMRSVFASLTANARGIFMLIVRYQLANGGPGHPHYTGMLLKDLYWASREAFLVSSDVALRAQLTEFTDHKLLRVKRQMDGAEDLLIPIEHALLQRFVDEMPKAS